MACEVIQSPHNLLRYQVEITAAMTMDAVFQGEASSRSRAARWLKLLTKELAKVQVEDEVHVDVLPLLQAGGKGGSAKEERMLLLLQLLGSSGLEPEQQHQYTTCIYGARASLVSIG